MSVGKQNLSEKLIKGYINKLPSLQEQAIRTLAVQLCQNVELKKDIIFASEPLQKNKYTTTNNTWNVLIEKHSVAICRKLPLPPPLKNLLVVRIRAAALQLFSWNRQQMMLDLSPLFADSLLMPSDWTVEMILDEKKIAERLVQDKRIPICQRYKIACFYCLEFFIHFLWKQISPKNQKDCLCYNECILVQLWSEKLAGKLEEKLPGIGFFVLINELNSRLGEFITKEDQFWVALLAYGIDEGSKSTVSRCYDKFRMILWQECLILAVQEPIKMLGYIKLRKEITGEFLMYFDRFSSPLPYTDILCFLLAQLSEEQRVSSFYLAVQQYKFNVLVFFLQWPYLDLLIPVIKELWNVLSEKMYGDLLLTLANHYSNKKYYSTEGNFYEDYTYGFLMIDLLEETPDHFKRYVFSHNCANKVGKLLLAVIKKKPLKIQNVNIFQGVWKHVTLEEKRAFLRSEYGESFCCHLALEQNWELLNLTIRECLSKDDISKFKEKVLISKSGKETCFQMLTRVNPDCMKSWLNWGFSSEQEIYQFLLKIYFGDERLDFKKVSDFKWIIEIDCFDNVIERYIPSEDARRKFKLRFIEMYAKYMCIKFAIYSKWDNVDRFLKWGFPLENSRKQFNKWFVKKDAMYVCEYHIARLNLQDTENFLTWYFPTKEAIEQFRQELFFTLGLKFPWVLLSRNAQDLDSLMKWFKLSPKAIMKFKRQVLFCSNSLSTIFDHFPVFENKFSRKKKLIEENLQKAENFLRWGLTDEETVLEFKYISNEYLMNLSFTDIMLRRLVQLKWDKLINEVYPIKQKSHDVFTLIVLGIVVGTMFAATNYLIDSDATAAPNCVKTHVVPSWVKSCSFLHRSMPKFKFFKVQNIAKMFLKFL